MICFGVERLILWETEQLCRKPGEEFTLLSKGAGEVVRDGKGFFTMRALPVTFSQVY